MAGLSLSNAPPQDPAAVRTDPQRVRITLAEVPSMAPSTAGKRRFGENLVQCRSSLDGSFGALVDAATRTAGADGFSHIVTDITLVEGNSARVAMIFRARNARGLAVVREARATIDLLSCAASDLSIPSA